MRILLQKSVFFPRYVFLTSFVWAIPLECSYTFVRRSSINRLSISILYTHTHKPIVVDNCWVSRRRIVDETYFIHLAYWNRRRRKVLRTIFIELCSATSSILLYMPCGFIYRLHLCGEFLICPRQDTAKSISHAIVRPNGPTVASITIFITSNMKPDRYAGRIYRIFSSVWQLMDEQINLICKCVARLW